MSHLVYIDPDEEIISVIGRLRKVTDTEVFFAVPKRAAFLQSLVNLRLLDRESKKLGKHLCLVTQDETGRLLAEKAGIETKSSLETVDGVASRAEDAALPARLSRVEQSAAEDCESLPGVGSAERLHSESIGSSSFFTKRESVVEASPGNEDAKTPVYPKIPSKALPATPSISSSIPRTIPVSDRTPKQLTTLNSVRDESSLKAPAPRVDTSVPSREMSRPISTPKPLATSASPASSSGGVPRVSFLFQAPPTPLSPSPSRSLQTPKNFDSVPAPASVMAPSSPSVSALPSKVASAPPPPPQPSLETPIARLYQHRATPSASSEKQSPEIPFEKKSGRRIFPYFVFGFVAVSILAAAGVSAFIFVPQAEVAILVKDSSESIDAEVLAKTDQRDVDTEGKIIPLRFLEMEKEISQSFPGTGKSSASDKRARGTITISNAFGKDPQSLIATTRFETSDGKIFRIVKGVTVPGAKETDGTLTPGTVEAEVVADVSGKEYNIEPASFTIPGFKGNAKYEKITARSTQPFLGGGEGDGGIASVSADDVIRAKETSEQKLSELIRVEFEKDLKPGEKILDDAILFEKLSSGAFPGTGAVAPSFDYRIRVSARAFVFSEADMRAVGATLFEEKLSPEDVSLEYTVPRPDFVSKSMLIKAKVSFSKRATVDVEKIKQSLLGKSVGEVQGIFPEYPNIEKIEVVFWPKFMTTRIPSRASQVTVTVKE